MEKFGSRSRSKRGEWGRRRGEKPNQHEGDEKRDARLEKGEKPWNLMKKSSTATPLEKERVTLCRKVGTLVGESQSKTARGGCGKGVSVSLYSPAASRGLS